jgi:hypothetical protein
MTSTFETHPGTPVRFRDLPSEFVRGSVASDRVTRIGGPGRCRATATAIACTRPEVRGAGVSAPGIARASGVDFDLRRDEPYLAYGKLQDSLKVVTRDEGDCLTRFECLLAQTEVHTYAWTENPLGISGYHLVSRGAFSGAHSLLPTRRCHPVRPQDVGGAAISLFCLGMVSLFAHDDTTRRGE